MLRFTAVKVADTRSEYATFQSHNQKVVETAAGVFMTYLADPGDEGGSIWRLARSTDEGATFATVYEGRALDKAPTLEADAQGMLYVVQPDKANRTATLLRFAPGGDLARPTTKTIPDGGRTAWKFNTFLDEGRGRIYYATVAQLFVPSARGT